MNLHREPDPRQPFGRAYEVLSAVHVGNGCYCVQAQAVVRVTIGARSVRAIEAIEDARQNFGADGRSDVLDADLHRLVAGWRDAQ